MELIDQPSIATSTRVTSLRFLFSARNQVARPALFLELKVLIPYPATFAVDDPRSNSDATGRMLGTILTAVVSHRMRLRSSDVSTIVKRIAMVYLLDEK